MKALVRGSVDVDSALVRATAGLVAAGAVAAAAAVVLVAVGLAALVSAVDSGSVLLATSG